MSLMCTDSERPRYPDVGDGTRRTTTRRETHPYLSMLLYPTFQVGSRSASEHRASKRPIVPAVQGRRGRPLDGVCGRDLR